MSVDDWARGRAVEGIQPDMTDAERAFWIAGNLVASQRLADALLSDEAVEAAATGYWKASMEDLDVGEKPTAEELEQFVWAARIVLHAAIDAVTKDARND